MGNKWLWAAFGLGWLFFGVFWLNEPNHGWKPWVYFAFAFLAFLQVGHLVRKDKPNA